MKIQDIPPYFNAKPIKEIAQSVTKEMCWQKPILFCRNDSISLIAKYPIRAYYVLWTKIFFLQSSGIGKLMSTRMKRSTFFSPQTFLVQMLLIWCQQMSDFKIHLQLDFTDHKLFVLASVGIQYPNLKQWLGSYHLKLQFWPTFSNSSNCNFG